MKMFVSDDLGFRTTPCIRELYGIGFDMLVTKMDICLQKRIDAFEQHCDNCRRTHAGIQPPVELLSAAYRWTFCHRTVMW